MTGIQPEIDKIVADVRAASGVPGLALCVDHAGKRYFSTAGTAQVGEKEPITSNARFDVSCLMKFFLSIALLKLESETRIDANCDITEFLPELGAPRGIRPVHMMSHVSGYHGLDITNMAVRWGSKWEDFTTKFREVPQLFPPGSTFNYEHSEHVILGEVLRQAIGQLPSDLIHTELLTPVGVQLADAASTPAGISSHAYSPRLESYIPANLPPFGPFWEASLPAKTITLGDVVTAASAILANDVMAARLRTPLISLPPMAISEVRAEKPPQHFSVACGLYEDGLLGHNGSMFGQTMGFRYDPRTGAIAAAGVNAYSAFARDAVLRRILDLLAGETSSKLQAAASILRWPQEDVMGALTLDAVVGRYIGSYLGELRVARAGTGLHVTVGPPGKRQFGFQIVTENNSLEIKSRAPVALKFQCAPDGEPMMFLGVHAYKRQP